MTSPNLTVLCHYRYDPLDQLISHALPDIPEHQRFYCKSRLATEIQGALHYSIVQHGDQLLAQQRSEGDVPDTTLLATDQQRSVLQTVKANHPPQPIAYSPYGHRTVGGGLLSLLGFNGERADRVTGHYLLGNGYRAFNPVLMRFNSPDNLSPFGAGGLNSYMYCLGDPINLSDPQGHSAHGKIVLKAFSDYTRKIFKRKAITKLSNSSLELTKKEWRKKINTTARDIGNEFLPTLKQDRLLEIQGREDGLVTPFNPPQTPSLAKKQYYSHKDTSIPFDKNGVPNPNHAILTTSYSLRTDFFDDAAAHFYVRSIRPSPKSKKIPMQNNLVLTILRRSEYIRKNLPERSQASPSS